MAAQSMRRQRDLGEEENLCIRTEGLRVSGDGGGTRAVPPPH